MESRVQSTSVPPLNFSPGGTKGFRPELQSCLWGFGIGVPVPGIETMTMTRDDGSTDGPEPGDWCALGGLSLPSPFVGVQNERRVELIRMKG